MFDGARAWMEEGGSPTLEEIDFPSLLIQVFLLNPLLFILLTASPMVSCLWSTQADQSFAGTASAAPSQVPVVGGRVLQGQRSTED